MAATVGSLVTEIILRNELSQADLANVLGWSQRTLSEIINGKIRLSADQALDLEPVCGVSADELVSIAARQELSATRNKRLAEGINSNVDIRFNRETQLPIRMLIERGDIPAKPGKEQEKALSEILSLAEDDVAWRKTGHQPQLTRIQKAWIGLARRKAGSFKVGKFDENTFAATAPVLIRTIKNGADFQSLQKKFAELGVALFYLSPFPNGKISGATFEVDGHPVIAITGLGKRLDKILFTLLHEAAHVARGDWKQGISAHEGERNAILSSGADAEKAADELAQHWAFPNGVRGASSEQINATAVAENVDRSLVIGRLQHDFKLPWRTMLAKNLTMLTEEDFITWA